MEEFAILRGGGSEKVGKGVAMTLWAQVRAKAQEVLSHR